MKREDLIKYLETEVFKKENVPLGKGEIVSDTNKFINSHIAILNSNNSEKIKSLFEDRLHKFLFSVKKSSNL